ncbi:MAG: efflux RND transporter permease subunit [Pseudomonadota bacterium]
MIALCLRYRRIILSIYLLLAITGFFRAFGMPVQLLPTVDRTEIQVGASWQQNAPEDVEVQMAVQLENALSTLPGLKSMESQISTGSVFTSLLFEDEADPIASLIATGARLNQLQSWPDDAEDPEIVQDGISESETVATLLLYPTGGESSDFSVIDEVARRTVIPALLAIPGVSRVDNSFSHREKVIWIEFDPLAMNQLNITIAELREAIFQLRDKSGGVIELGKDSVALRFLGQPEMAAISQHIIKWQDSRAIYLGDIADVGAGYTASRNITYKSGNEAYYLSLKRGRGQNSFDIVQSIKRRIAELNDTELEPLGLELGISFDTTENIERAIETVAFNLVIGIALVYCILFFFLRQHVSALVVISTVPISVCLTLFLLSTWGASLNVISLAGLAFSVGLIIDAAVVVQEAIEAQSENEPNLLNAITKAVAKVAKALFASTVTTLLIFIPIAGFDGDVGHLLADLALTMALAMSVSFIVAMVVLPLLVTLFPNARADTHKLAYWQEVARIVSISSNSKIKRSAIIALLVVIPLAIIPLVLPERELLPNAGDTYLRASISIPQGRNVETLRRELAEELIARLDPYMQAGAGLPVRSYNLVVATDFAFVVAYPEDPEQLNDLIREFRQKIFKDLPEVTAYVAQEPMIFFRSSESRQIQLNVHGSNLVQILKAAESIRSSINERGIAEGVRITPAAADDAQLLLVSPNGWADRDFGFSQSELSDVVSAYSGGLYAGEFVDGLDTYDFYLRGPRWQNSQELGRMQVPTPNGATLNLGTLARVEEARGPSRILRVDGQSTVRLLITPPSDAALGAVVSQLRTLVAEDYAADLMAKNMFVSFRGSADEFEQAMARLAWVVLVALVCLMAALTLVFSSLTCAIQILMTLPIALFGGAVALWVINFVTPVALDVLTIMGFIIAAGLVLNNAILIIAEHREGVASGLDRALALKKAVEIRSRPIYISALTSIFGMLPLMLSPGVGAQMYRGMATVLVGSMTFSLIFCVFVVAAVSSYARDKTVSASPSPPL